MIQLVDEPHSNIRLHPLSAYLLMTGEHPVSVFFEVCQMLHGYLIRQDNLRKIKQFIMLKNS